MLLGLQRRGMEIEVMTRAHSHYAARMSDAGITLYDYQPERHLSAAAVRKIRATLKRGGHDALYLFNNHAISNGAAAAIGLPVRVVTYRGQVGNINRYDPSAYLKHLNPRVDRIVCVARAVRDHLRKQLSHPHQALTIYKGHDPAWYQNVTPIDRARLGVPDDAFLVITAAHNRPRKGIPILIKAIAGLPEDMPVHALLMGTGMDGAALRNQVAATGKPERFHLFGYRADVLSCIAAADVAVLPTIRREGLPRLILESMGVAIPAIVTDSGGSPELVDPGRSGLVVEAGNVRQLTAAISQLARNKNQRLAMGQAAQQRLAKHFNLRRSIDQHLELFASL